MSRQRPKWRKSTYSSGNGGACVEIAMPAAGTVHVRNSNHPDRTTLALPSAAMAGFVAACAAGAHDDLTGS